MVDRFPTLLTFLFLTVLLTCIFLFGGALCASIPNEAVKENIVKSEQFMVEEDEYILYNPLFRKDKFSESIILGESGIEDSLGVFHKILLNPTISYNPDKSLTESYIDYYAGVPNTGVGTYGRYWHGFQSVIKPLLVFIPYSYIRILNYFLLFGLALFCTYLINFRISWRIGYIFLISLCLCGFTAAPELIQFSTCFYIAFLGIIWLLMHSRERLTEKFCYASFFCIGGLTVYFDFLTTPLLTLGLPLTVLIMYRSENPTLTSTIKLIISWGLGYFILWLMKWIIATIFTEENLIENAFNQIIKRTGGEVSGDEDNAGMWPWNFVILSFLSIWMFVSAIPLIVDFKRMRAVARKYSSLILIAALPFIWVMVVRNHSWIHYWYVWRIFGVAIFALLVYWYKILQVVRQKQSVRCKG